MKPVLFVTGHAPADRAGAFACLHECENVFFALFGGRSQHGAGPASELAFPHREVRQRDVFALASGGAYRAVVCSTGGRVALPLAWAGARRGRLPLILWSSLWAHPRSAPHALSYLALRRLYHSADAVVTYGPHVSAYVAARGARNVQVAPQSVDNDFWSARGEVPPEHPAWPAKSATKFLFVGRPVREKGLDVLLSAWRALSIDPGEAALVAVGVEPADVRRAARGTPIAGVSCAGRLSAPMLRNFYAAADVLVVPSIPSRTFREPWGLVVNEAFNQQLPVIASDAVGAAAGGLVRDHANGLILPAADPAALAGAIRALAADPELRARMGAAGARDVRGYSYAAWAEGFSHALATLGLSMRNEMTGGDTVSVA